MSKGKIVAILFIIVALFIIVPVVQVGQTASFGGSDDAGSEAISEIQGEEYEPWFTPLIEGMFMEGELPGELESLLFCLQTGLGAGLLFFFIGKLSERTKWQKKLEEKGISVDDDDNIVLTQSSAKA